MRKWMAVSAAVLAAAAAVTAASGARTSAPGQQARESKSYNITFDLGVDSGPFEISLWRGARDAANALGVKVKLVAPHTADANLQIQQLNSVLAAKTDFLIIQPDDANALIAPMRQFKRAGIPALTVDTDVNSTSLRLGNLTSNNKQGGQLAAKEMNKLLAGKGKVLYIGYIPGATTTDQRKQGWEQAINKYSGLKYVGPQFTQDDQSDAASKVSAALQRNPDLAGIFASDEANAIGAATAVQNAGKRGKVKIVAFDGAPDEVSYLKRGVIQELIVQKAYGMGYQSVQYAVAYLRHKKRPPRVTHPTYVIATKANINSGAVKKYLYH